MRFAAICSALALLLLPASVQAMPVATFLAKADALKAKGLLAMGSPDIKLLKGEMQQVGASYRARLQADRDAGRTPHSCPPPKGKAKLNGKEMMAYLRAIPAERQKTMSVKTAFFALMASRYPCAKG